MNIWCFRNMNYSTRLANALSMLKELPNNKSPVKLFVDFIEQNGFRMVCFDFDGTIIEYQTCGYALKDNVSSIRDYITEDFRLVANELKSRGIKIAVVTFSDNGAIRNTNKYVGGEPLVREVLLDEYPEIPIYARLPYLYQKQSEYKPLGLNEPMHISKNYHLEKAATDAGINVKDTILIDDNENNCRKAKILNVLAFNVCDNFGFKLSNIRII